MRRIVAFPGFVVLLLAFSLVLPTSGEWAAPGSGGSAPSASAAGFGTEFGADYGTWVGLPLAGAPGLRVNSVTHPCLDGAGDHSPGHLRRLPGAVGSSVGLVASPPRGPEISGRPPLPPFATTLPPPADVRT